MFDSKKIKPLLNQNIVEQIISAQGFEVKNHFFKLGKKKGQLALVYLSNVILKILVEISLRYFFVLATMLWL